MKANIDIKKYTSTFLIIVVLLTTVSCNSFLDVVPDMRTQLDSPEKVGELLVSAYPKADYMSFTEFRSDNVEDKGISTDYFSVGNTGVVWEDQYFWRDVENMPTTQGSPDFYWAQCYLAIATANTALAYINENPTNAQLFPYRGEALVARAYAHFMLVNLFAQQYRPNLANDSPGIPYVTLPETTVFGSYDRGTVAQVYNNIEADLREGLPLINNSVYIRAPKFHFTTEAAHAFATRFYLFKGDYARAIEHASAIYGSRDEYRANLRPWNTTYNSSILVNFRNMFTMSTQRSTLLLGEASSIWGRSGFIRYGLGQRYLSNTLNSSNNILGKPMNVYRNFNREPYFSLEKFMELFYETQIGSGIGQPYVMIPLFTVDEALINRAEAFAASGQTVEALADLNTFLSTRVPQYNNADIITEQRISNFYPQLSLQQGIIETILYYKQLEFTSEGLRWFDINRHQIDIQHVHLDQNQTQAFQNLPATDPRRVLQLPQSAVQAGLPLNPR